MPKVDLQKMSGCFRQRVVAFFVERKLWNERLANNMLGWTHSGFSLDASIRIPAGSAETREALAQYIVRPPVSLQHLLVDQGGTDTVLCSAPYSDCFHTDTKVFPAMEVLGTGGGKGYRTSYRPVKRACVPEYRVVDPGNRSVVWVERRPWQR